MSQIWLYSLGSVLLVSLISLIGLLAVALKTENLKRFMSYMISFSAGALLGDAFIHLLPEVVEEVGFTLEISFMVLTGIGLSFVIEKIIHWRHCHHLTTDDHPHPFAWMNLVGDFIHNFIDGLIIGASYLVSIPVGMATTAAVALHEIPQEIGDFGVLVHGGFSKRKALLLNFLSALGAVVGAVVALILGTYADGLEVILVPFAAGMFIYIASADLIPELHKEVKWQKSLTQFFIFVLGVLIMFSLIKLESVHGHGNDDEHLKHHDEQIDEDHNI